MIAAQTILDARPDDRAPHRRLHRRRRQTQPWSRWMGRRDCHTRWPRHRTGRRRAADHQQQDGAERRHRRAHAPGAHRWPPGHLHRLHLRHPGRHAVGPQLAAPRLEDRRRWRGAEPRAVGRTVGPDGGAAAALDRLALRAGTLGHPRQRARRCDCRRLCRARQRAPLRGATRGLRRRDPRHPRRHQRAEAQRLVVRPATADRRRARRSLT